MYLGFNNQYAGAQLYNNKLLAKKQSSKSDKLINDIPQYNTSPIKNHFYQSKISFTGKNLKKMPTFDRELFNKYGEEIFDNLKRQAFGERGGFSKNISSKQSTYNAYTFQFANLLSEGKITDVNEDEAKLLLHALASPDLEIVKSAKQAITIIKESTPEKLESGIPLETISIIFGNLFDKAPAKVKSASETMKWVIDNKLIKEKLYEDKKDMIFDRLLNYPKTENYLMEVVGSLGQANLFREPPNSEVINFIKSKTKPGNSDETISIAKNTLKKLRETTHAHNVKSIPDKYAEYIEKEIDLENIKDESELKNILSSVNRSIKKSIIEKNPVNSIPQKNIDCFIDLINHEDEVVSGLSINITNNLLNTTELIKSMPKENIKEFLKKLDNGSDDLIKDKLSLLTTLVKKKFIEDRDNLINFEDIKYLIELAKNDENELSGIAITALQALTNNGFMKKRGISRLSGDIQQIFDQLNENSKPGKVIRILGFIRSLAKADHLEDVSKINLEFIYGLFESENKGLKDSSVKTVKHLIQYGSLNEIPGEKLDIIKQDLYESDRLKVQDSLRALTTLIRNNIKKEEKNTLPSIVPYVQPDKFDIEIEDHLAQIFKLISDKDPGTANESMDAVRTLSKAESLPERDKKNIIDSVYENLKDPSKAKKAMETIGTFVMDKHIIDVPNDILKSIFELAESDNHKTKAAAVKVIGQLTEKGKINEIPENVLESIFDFTSDVVKELKTLNRNNFTDEYYQYEDFKPKNSSKIEKAERQLIEKLKIGLYTIKLLADKNLINETNKSCFRSFIMSIKGKKFNNNNANNTLCKIEEFAFDKLRIEDNLLSESNQKFRSQVY